MKLAVFSPVLHRFKDGPKIETFEDAVRYLKSIGVNSIELEAGAYNGDGFCNCKDYLDHPEKIENLTVLKDDINYDLTKIFIKMKGLTGLQLEKILEEDYRIEVESASDIGVLILCNLGNKRSDFIYLADCLEKIAKSDYKDIYYLEKRKHMPMLEPIIKISLREAYYADKEIVTKENAIGRISAELVAECPPGISILLPGELITEEHLPYLNDYNSLEVVKI